MPTASPARAEPHRDAARELAVVLHDLVWLLPRTLDAEVEDSAELESLPASELEVMRLLVRRPGLTVSQVAAELGLQRTNASAAVRTLLGRGLLRRERDPADGRVSRLSPTPRAQENRDRREAAWAAALRTRLAVLPPAERDRVLSCATPLRAFADALSCDARPS
jgi:DNA-binding MarR family transcriptional regulator